MLIGTLSADPSWHPEEQHLHLEAEPQRTADVEGAFRRVVGLLRFGQGPEDALSERDGCTEGSVRFLLLTRGDHGQAARGKWIVTGSIVRCTTPGEQNPVQVRRHPAITTSDSSSVRGRLLAVEIAEQAATQSASNEANVCPASFSRTRERARSILSFLAFSSLCIRAAYVRLWSCDHGDNTPLKEPFDIGTFDLGLV